jgi:hypothetical protein
VYEEREKAESGAEVRVGREIITEKNKAAGHGRRMKKKICRR